MEVEVISQRENVLLGRTEIEFRISQEKGPTPSRETIRDAIAKLFKTSKEKVILDRVRPGFGATSARGYAKVYGTTERAKEIESKHILVRNRLLEKVVKEVKEKPKEATEKRG